MSDLFSDVNIQELLLILLISFMVSITIAGFFIKKFRLFDNKKKKNKDNSVSGVVGGIMMLLGSIVGFTAIMTFILSLIEN